MQLPAITLCSGNAFNDRKLLKKYGASYQAIEGLPKLNINLTYCEFYKDVASVLNRDFKIEVQFLDLEEKVAANIVKNQYHPVDVDVTVREMFTFSNGICYILSFPNHHKVDKVLRIYITFLIPT